MNVNTKRRSLACEYNTRLANSITVISSSLRTHWHARGIPFRIYLHPRGMYHCMYPRSKGLSLRMYRMLRGYLFVFTSMPGDISSYAQHAEGISLRIYSHTMVMSLRICSHAKWISLRIYSHAKGTCLRIYPQARGIYLRIYLPACQGDISSYLPAWQGIVNIDGSGFGCFVPCCTCELCRALLNHLSAGSTPTL